jgi:hypothetical protein
MFQEFAKIARLNRPCTITEKLDGTNAHVYITDATTLPTEEERQFSLAFQDGHHLLAGSRTRYVTPDSDNFGFARWVKDHASELFALGTGHHYGEWWGPGIQRGYGQRGKVFSLFNTARWVRPTDVVTTDKQTLAPACCDVVPVLYEGPFDTTVVRTVLDELRKNGSVASPGFLRPEGIVIFHSASRQLFKVTVEKDEQPKGKQNA